MSSVVPPHVDARLYNPDLAPPKERNWGLFSLFAMWMSDIHSIGGYTFAAGLFALGLGALHVFAGLSIGIIIVFLMMNLVGFAGQRTGLCYPVLARISFGTIGSNVPALTRGFVAIAWYGIQTWLASKAFILLIADLWPEVATMGSDINILGETPIGWIAFIVMWALQLALLTNGMETIRKFTDYAGPGVWIVMFILTAYVLWKAGWSVNLVLPGAEAEWGVFHAFMAAISLTVSYFAALLLNFCDFSRFAPTKKAVWQANLLGLPVNFILFAVVSVLVTAGSYEIYGEYIYDPVELVAHLDSKVAILLGALTFTIATIGINVVANFVSPAYDFANAWPEKITFKRGGLITALIALVITPWNLFNNPVIINIFLAAVGAVLGPLFGIIIADYYLIRRGKVVVSELFKVDGDYSYKNGWNMKAVWVMLGTSIPSAIIAVWQTDVLRFLSPFSYFIGIALGGIVYYLVSYKDPYILKAIENAENTDFEKDLDSVSLSVVAE